MNYNYFSLMMNLIKKDNIYYDNIYILASDIASVNIPSDVISFPTKFFLNCLNENKIKEIYDKIYEKYKSELDINIKEESETEKNKMKNISDIFIDFSFLYISIFPKDIINTLIKLGNIIALLKIKKFNNFEKITKNILLKIKTLIYLPICCEKEIKNIYNKYHCRNIIISKELEKINNINENIKNENKIYYDIIKQILNFIINIFNDESNILKLFIQNLNNNNINLINEREKIFLFFRLKDYIIYTMDKSDELYKKYIKNIFDTIYSKFIPVSSKYMWLKILNAFIKDEYNDYKIYKNIQFKSEEEFNNIYKEFKYKIKGKKKLEILPIYVDSIRISEFKSE